MRRSFYWKLGMLCRCVDVPNCLSENVGRLGTVTEVREHHGVIGITDEKGTFYIGYYQGKRVGPPRFERELTV